MRTMDKHKSVASLVTEQPALSRVFERLGIDYCCGGQRPLEDACRQKGLNVEDVLRQLSEAGGSEGPAPDEDWTQVSLGALTEHIQKTYHEPLREELKRLSLLLTKVVGVHGDRQSELKELMTVFQEFKEGVEQHMEKEDTILFPWCRMLDGRSTGRATVRGPITVMLAEHEKAGSELDRMRQLTGNYTLPADACRSYLALFDGLRKLESDMHEHVHKENYILFPRAIAAESSKSARVSGKSMP